ncbi:Proline-rich transmembrane protein 4 [Saguinus oedipus]|uniref:Proline-rich transmembrane protein 4 n=1 Tax=Saguinus oedipus TaxID=9490 RepID=A0ABQ9UIH3_SAGOE|nr:Proline-rich transmembrane protein 4 [Saguinus oedipus]
MAGYGCLGLELFCCVLLAVPVGPQPTSSVPGALVTTLTPPPQSEASMLSLNLGLNFKFHLRGPAAVWGSPVTETQSLSLGPGQEPGEEVASGLRTDPLWELLVGSARNSPPEWGSAEGGSKPRASSLLPESTSWRSGPSDWPTAPYQPRRSTVTWDTALTATALPSSAPRPHQSELELKFDMALRAGAAPTLGHRTLPLLPSLRASLAEIAGRLGPFGEYLRHPKESPCGVPWYHCVPTLPGEEALQHKSSGPSCFLKFCLDCNNITRPYPSKNSALAPGSGGTTTHRTEGTGAGGEVLVDEARESCRGTEGLSDPALLCEGFTVAVKPLRHPILGSAVKTTGLPSFFQLQT